MWTITIPVLWLGTLFVTFVAKHLVADFLLQNGWMAYGKAKAEGWLVPLSVHAGIHGALTLLIMLVLLPSYWWLGFLDFAVHAIIDRGKALATSSLGLTEKDNPWWWLLGIDHALHDLTHFAYILVILIEGR
jgi:hypothetical protein